MSFSDLFDSNFSAFLEEFESPDQIAKSSVEDLINFISPKSKNRSSNLDDKVTALNKAMRASFRLNQTAYEPINIAIVCSLNIIKFYQQQLKNIDKAILSTTLGLDSNAYNILLSIRGIGKVYAAGIMAEVDNIEMFPHNSKLAKYFGLYWKKNQSGEFDSFLLKIYHIMNTIIKTKKLHASSFNIFFFLIYIVIVIAIIKINIALFKFNNFVCKFINKKSIVAYKHHSTREIF